MKLKLLHIISDEKFPDAAYEQFESIIPGQSTYLLPEIKQSLQYLKKIKPIQVSKFSFLNPIFIRSLKKYDAIILHSLTNFAIELVSRLHKDVVFIWIGMGYDYYDIIYPNPYDLLEDQTIKIVKEIDPNYGITKSPSLIKKFIKSIIYYKQKNKIDCIQLIDIFCPVIPVESRLLEEKIGYFTPKTIPWNYGSSLNVFDNNIEYNNLTGNNILVGNSATPTNNHAEVFKILYDLDLPNKTKIFVPLSYGSSEYRDKIIQLGYEYFGNQFVPITKFMNLTEYFKLIQKCSVMIMNHRRQQGAGNIGLGLYVGAKIFLNKVSPLYQFYTDKKAIIYSCDQITSILSGGISPLSQNDFILNHQLLERIHGRKTTLNKTKCLLKEIQEISFNKK